MKLYQLTNCPYCKNVRHTLETKGIEFETIEVPRSRPDRVELKELSGQEGVPVIVDGDKIMSDSERIISYLEEKY